MSYADRYEAEDIANGTPLSGPDQLVERIEDALYDHFDRGYEEGYEEGYRDALGEVIRVLELSGKPPEDNDERIEWIRAEIEKERENRSQDAT